MLILESVSLGGIKAREYTGEGNGKPLQYSCLEDPTEGSLVGYSPWGRKESDMTELLSRQAHSGQGNIPSVS